MVICAGRTARQSPSAHGTCGPLATGNPPAPFARQFPPSPLPAQNRSDTARLATGRFRQSDRQGTTHPFRCSPTSQRQCSVLSRQWSVEPAKKRQAVAINRQVGDAIAILLRATIPAPLLIQEGSPVACFLERRAIIQHRGMLDAGRDDVPRGEEFTVHSLQFTLRIQNALTVDCRL